jgi:fructose-specific phosphotransferase system IIC component
LGSATLAACLIAALLEVTIPFKGTSFLGALLGGAIMGYLVNRKIRDITAYLVLIIPLAWLAYGIRGSAGSYSQVWAHQSWSA